MRKRSNFKSMELTPRTYEILQEIDDFGFRTFTELRKTVLKSYSRPWAWRIMKRLVVAKLIRRVADKEGCRLGWSPHVTLTSFLQNQHAGPKVERGRVPKYCSSFHHDQELRWVLDQLKVLPIVKRVIADSKLKRDLFSGTRGYSRREISRLLSFVPDSRVTIQNNGTEYEVAIELELSTKAKARVEAKLEHYIAKSNYDFVVYICGSAEVRGLIVRSTQAVHANSPAVKFASKKVPIYQCDFSELKADFMNAKIKGPNDEFSFGEITA